MFRHKTYLVRIRGEKNVIKKTTTKSRHVTSSYLIYVCAHNNTSKQITLGHHLRAIPRPPGRKTFSMEFWKHPKYLLTWIQLALYTTALKGRFKKWR